MFDKAREMINQKNETEIAILMKKYGLENVSEEDRKTIYKIITDLAGTGVLKAGTVFSKGEDKVKIAYLYALVQQNWLIIRQLDRISTYLNR